MRVHDNVALVTSRGKTSCRQQKSSLHNRPCLPKDIPYMSQSAHLDGIYRPLAPESLGWWESLQERLGERVYFHEQCIMGMLGGREKQRLPVQQVGHEAIRQTLTAGVPALRLGPVFAQVATFTFAKGDFVARLHTSNVLTFPRSAITDALGIRKNERFDFYLRVGRENPDFQRSRTQGRVKKGSWLDERIRLDWVHVGPLSTRDCFDEETCAQAEAEARPWQNRPRLQGTLPGISQVKAPETKHLTAVRRLANRQDGPTNARKVAKMLGLSENYATTLLRELDAEGDVVGEWHLGAMRYSPKKKHAED